MPTGARITTRYSARAQPEFVEDDFDGQIWQPDVYDDAARVARAFEARGIIDIGCGEGAKLAALNDEFETTGLDLPRNIATCRQRYPAGNWIEHDLMSSVPLPLFGDGKVIICADVIEHVSNPVLLLAKLAKALERAHALLSLRPSAS